MVMTIHLHLSKAWCSARDTAAEIMRKLLKKKLYVDEEQVKCRLRYKRMMLTMDELIKLLKNPYCYVEDKMAEKMEDGTMGSIECDTVRASE